MEQRKSIPRFNQDLEFPLIMYIFRKNLIWIIAVLVVLLAFSFLYLRYTIPHYESATVIQLTEENTQLNFFEEKKMMNMNQTLASDIELIRSQVFIQRIVDSLDVEVTYFKDGRILDYDNYNQAGYHVTVFDNSPEVFGVPVYIKFNSTNDFNLKYKVGKEKFDINLKTNTPQKTPHFNLMVNVIDSNACLKPFNADYFIVNSKGALLAKFSAQLKITVLNEQARTIRISCTDVNPQRASDISNRVAKEFTNFNLEKKREGVNNIIAYIDNTLELVRLNLNEADSSLQSFMQEHGIVERKNENNPIENKNLSLLEMLENQKFDYDIQLLVLNDVIKNVTKQDLDIYEILTQISQLNSDVYISGLADNINLLIAKRDRLLQGKTVIHPDVVEVNREIDLQRSLLIKSLETIKASTQTKITELQSSIDKIEGTLFAANGNLPNQVEYMHKKRYFEVNETYYQLLIQKRVEYELLSKGYTSGYQILQRSAPAKLPIYPRKFFVLAGVLVVWLLIALIVLTLNYILYDRILAFEHITNYCDVSMLGFVTKYKNAIPVSQLVVDKKPKSLIAESFRNIRSNLDFISNKPGSKLIAVTSTISGEGKTFVSINLAGILAFTGKKVIIIDADMRKPKIHVGFNISNEKGLSNLLIGKNNLSECIFHSELENLHFITAGPVPPNPSELILSTAMTVLIDQLLKDYDYVLIDNPPIGIVTDSMTLLQRADYPIYVFRAGVSRKFFINNLQKLVLDNKIKNISIVLNGLDQKKSNQYGYGNYGYTTNSYGYGYYDEDHKKRKFKFSLRRKK
jgi:tyrosine-protein kinase Etk/Wzc